MSDSTIENIELFIVPPRWLRPTAPGLGIEINEDKVREMAAIGHKWRNPIWRTFDGTIAEW